MASEALGTIRVDLVAMTASFLKDLDKSAGKLEEWHRNVEKSLERTDRAFEKIGKKLTLKITAPLAALAVAAARVSDPTNQIGDDLIRLGLQAQQALKPLGDALVRVWEKAEPVIERGIEILANVGEAFARLSPETQDMIIEVGAAVAAIGPLMLGMSAVTQGLLLLWRPLGIVIQSTSFFVGLLPKILPALPAIARSIGFIGAEIAAFEFGRYIFDQFRDVQEFMADLVYSFDHVWQDIKFGASFAALGIRQVWIEVIQYIEKQLADLMDYTGRHLAAAANQMPETLAAPVKKAAKEMLSLSGSMYASLNMALVRPWSDVVKELEDERKAAIDQAFAIRGITLDNIKADFDTRKGKKSFFEFVSEDFKFLEQQVETSSLGKSIQELMDSFDKLFAHTNERPKIVTDKDLRLLYDADNLLNKWWTDARQLRWQFYPEEQYQDDLAKLNDLKAVVPELVDDFVYTKRLQELQDKLISAKAAQGDFFATFGQNIQNMSKQWSDAIADFVLEGKNGFKQLLLSIEKMAISSAVNSFLAPLFGSVGRFIGGGFGGSPGLGDGFGIVPHATGGIIDQPAAWMVGPRTIGTAAEGGRKEVIAPLFTSGGVMGVRSTAPQVNVQVVDQRSAGAPTQVTSSRGQDGRTQIRILVRDAVKSLVGEGALDADLRQSFGLRRVGSAR